MPSVLVSALYHLNLLLDRYTFPSVILYDWTQFLWQMNHQRIKQNRYNSFYFATMCRLLFIAASLSCVLVLYPLGFLKLSEAVVSLTVSCMVFVTLFADALMLSEGPSWLRITNWLFLKDQQFSLKTQCCNRQFYIFLINTIWKGNLDFKNKIKHILTILC